MIERKHLKDGVVTSNTVCTVRNKQVFVGIINSTSKRVTFPQNWPIARVCVLSYKDDDSNEYVEERPQCVPFPNMSHLESEQRAAISELLEKHRHAISQHDRDLGRCDLVEHRIDT